MPAKEIYSPLKTNWTQSKKVWLTFVMNVTAVIFLFFIGIFIGLFVSNKKLIENEMLTRARSDFKNIVYTRKWNALHGGVYVLKRPGTISNPYLEEPDITSTDGRVFTMKNPALMTREISELSSKDDDYHFHITSLKPLNPNNAPDAFEKAALQDFEKGSKEIYGKHLVNERYFFRYMAPLYVEKPCLTCHEKQGYKTGDVRGGISVSFNINNIEKSIKKNKFIVTGLFILTTLTLLLIIYFFVLRLNKRLSQALIKIEEMAITDPLTGLFNRRYLMERLEEEISRGKRYNHWLSCLLIDVDHFKQVNDTYGHHAGDTVLHSVSKMLKETFRKSDIIARYGGEEFIVILPETSLDDANYLAEKYRILISGTRIGLDDFVSIQITVSIGITGYSPEEIPEKSALDKLVSTADQAMYKAKTAGRNKTELLRVPRSS